MKNNIVVILVLLTVFTSCNKKKNNSEEINFKYSKQVENLIGFFDRYAYDSIQKTYYSEIDNDGNVVSKNIYNVALSRLIYGLSYTSKWNSENLKLAKNAANFQLKNLVKSGALASSFISNIENGTPSQSYQIDIWQQAYGLCGLSELYRIEKNEELLLQIHQLHNAFVQRFKDTVNGGFFGNYKFSEGQISGSKSLQSLMYPITAYMENLWLADTKNSSKYESYLKENLAIAYKNAWNSDLGWANIKFDDQWNPCQHLSAKKPCYRVTPGHNFQLASLFLRTKDWKFLTADERKKYQKLGLEILNTTLKKQIYPNTDLSQGFYSEVNPVSNKVTDKRKMWWQHCEAHIALSFTDGKFEKEIKALEAFYFNSFPDKINGGEYFYVTENDEPITTELKGSIGKSIYHTIEMIRFRNKKTSESNENK